MARELNAAIRKEKGTHAVGKLRRKGLLPAVLYRDGKIGVNLELVNSEWKKLLASGQRVVTLKMQGGDKQALIKDVQYDPLGEQTLHVDFSELREGETVMVAVPIITKGIPKGQVDGGVLSQPVHTLHVKCLPEAIPEKIVIEVEGLGVDDVVRIKELKLPESVKAVDDAETVVVAVHLPRVEEVAAPVEGAPLEPEVLTAKKEEEPAEGAAEAPAEKEKKEEKKEKKEKK
jgi:large subunit ribosomal protein L25